MFKRFLVSAFVLFVIVMSGANAATITVNTDQHNNTVGDNTITLVEAIMLVNSAKFASGEMVRSYGDLSAAEQALCSGDPALEPDGPHTIAFDFSGTGEFRITVSTETVFSWGTGFPPIVADNVTIDGFTAAGSAPNSNPISSMNNAIVKVIIDARSGAASNYPVGRLGSNHLKCIFSTYGENTVFRGLSILGGQADGETDKNIAIGYGSRMINSVQCDALGGWVQGCFIGVDPDGLLDDLDDTQNGRVRRGVYYQFDGAGWPEENSLEQAPRGSEQGPTIGTNGDGNNDRGEFNIIWAEEYPVDLWVCYGARISGNHLCLKRDGSVRNNMASEGCLRVAHSHGWVFGTDGDGVSDENEANYFAFNDASSTADDFKLIRGFHWDAWGGIGGCMYGVFAGNVIGQDIYGQGGSMVCDFHYDMGPRMIRFGTNNDGVSDELEGNIIANISRWDTGPLEYAGRLHSSIWPGDDRIPSPNFSMVGNSIFNTVAYYREPNRTWHGKVFAPAASGGDYASNITVEDPMRATLDPSSTYDLLVGALPYKSGVQADATITAMEVDLYVAAYDPSKSDGKPGGFDNPNNFTVNNYTPQGKVYLGSFPVSLPASGDSAPFSIDISAVWDTPVGSAFRGQDVYLTAAPTWTLDLGSVQFAPAKAQDWYYPDGTVIGEEKCTGQFGYEVMVSVPAGPPPTSPPSEAAVGSWQLYE